ncbi:odorant receptor 131-2-like [Boleophthalmus pectinirostris]|uniref:odorant receptor 131-2-like n=1 Tax=Boleophthalmus pectinirostris TaxID=150288 RepID=UPI00242B707F|nr:odorant receptor 131-2-like [Boleophthalmus pectinirostris]
MEFSFQSNSSSENLTGAKVFFLCATSAPCCLFLIINGTILAVLRSKPSFSQCPRYVLLFNLVLGDTVLIAQAQTLYLLASFQIRISYPLCGCLAMVSFLTSYISPYTLIFMSLERCVAVCFPFRHSAVVTLRNTFICIFLTWMFSFADILTRVVLLLRFPFRDLPTLLMPSYCNNVGMLLNPGSKVYSDVFTYILFLSCSLIISSSFVAVMVVAHAASSQKESADKAKKTLLLHMFQLFLNLVSTLNMTLFTTVEESGQQHLVGKFFVVVYILVILTPRGVSALTYGLRDPKLRPLLLSRLCCCVRVRLGPVKLHMTLQRSAKV